MHLVKECEVSLAAGAGLVAELGHADRPAVRLLDREAQDVPAIMPSCKLFLMYQYSVWLRELRSRNLDFLRYLVVKPVIWSMFL